MTLGLYHKIATGCILRSQSVFSTSPKDEPTFYFSWAKFGAVFQPRTEGRPGMELNDIPYLGRFLEKKMHQ